MPPKPPELKATAYPLLCPSPPQNVRRQGGEIWETMTNWVPPEHMRHVVMAAAVYDLNTGRVDIFGLQTT